MKLLILFLASFACLNSYVISMNKGISAELTLEKNIFFEGEAIVINLKFTNNGTSDFKIGYNCDLKHDILFYLEFKDEKEKINKLISGVIADCVGDAVTIESGESYKLDNIRIDFNDLHHIKDSFFLPKGEYLLTSTYGAISNSVKIKIVEK